MVKCVPPRLDKTSHAASLLVTKSGRDLESGIWGFLIIPWVAVISLQIQYRLIRRERSTFTPHSYEKLPQWGLDELQAENKKYGEQALEK